MEQFTETYQQRALVILNRNDFEELIQTYFDIEADSMIIRFMFRQLKSWLANGVIEKIYLSGDRFEN